MKQRPNGLSIGKKRVPIGVVGIIYEARPNVTSDAFGLCFKTGNVVINNPGMEEDVWYLVYDEPGSPAKSVKLFFEEVPDINIGDRITVEGVFEGEKVIVKRIVDNSIDL